MRVALGVAVAGEVFEGGNDATVLHPVHVEGGLAAHLVAVLAEGAAVNHGVAAIVVDVDTGSEVEVDADGLALFGHLKPHLVDQGVVLLGKGAEGHLAREGHAAVEAHGRPPFAVDGHEEGYVAHGLQPFGEHSFRSGIAFEKADAAGLHTRH